MDDIKKTDTVGGSLDKAPILEGYLTEDQLAAALHRSPRTLARWRSIGEGPPALRLGRQLLYRRESVAAWLASLEQDA